MKTLFLYLLFASLSFAAYGQKTTSTNDNANIPFTLSIGFNNDTKGPEETAAKTVKLGSEITIRVRKTNTSDHPITKLGPENGASGLALEVLDSNGNPVPPHKQTDKWIRGGGPGAGVNGDPKSFELQPGESRTDYAFLSRWFDLTNPGTYTIQVSEHVSNAPNSALVESNKLIVTITP